MSDPSGPSSSPSPLGSGVEDADKYAQALRFLISLQAQEKQDVDAQRDFLRTKGLSDEVIDRALAEAQRPDSIAQDGLVKTVPQASSDLSDADAFDRAAKMFDDPLHATLSDEPSASPDPPPRTYPRSPLLLYHQQNGNGPTATSQVSSLDNPLTRYHVLLRFFRSLCYFLVLGGGVASIAVGIYRAYMMPRLIATLDARSDLLKHHRSLYATIAGRVRTLRGNSLAPASAQAAHDEATGATTPAPRKGVLKKVQFADEVREKAPAEENTSRDALKATPDDEDKKQAGDAADSSDVATKNNNEKSANTTEEGVKEAEVKGEGEVLLTGEKKSDLAPIDIMEPLRASLARLHKALQADMSASAIGSPLHADSTSSSASSGAREGTKSAKVEDESDAESWVSDEEDSEELEFDPFAPPSTKSRSSSSSKRKPTPKVSLNTSTAPSTTSTAASDSAATTLKSSLNTINAYINTQTYMANANVYGARSLGYTGVGTLSGDASQSASSTTNKAGEVGQVRAEIRSLKGLLLSRRNFPIYNRPAVPRVEPAA